MSPLRRALQTAQVIHEGMRNRAHSAKLPIFAISDLQETSDSPCDTGHPAHLLEAEFPEVDFSGVADDWFNKKSQGNALTVDRITRFSEWLASRPEQRIVCIGHLDFFNHLLGVRLRNCGVARYQLSKDGWRQDAVAQVSKSVIQQWLTGFHSCVVSSRARPCSSVTPSRPHSLSLVCPVCVLSTTEQRNAWLWAGSTHCSHVGKSNRAWWAGMLNSSNTGKWSHSRLLAEAKSAFTTPQDTLSRSLTTSAADAGAFGSAQRASWLKQVTDQRKPHKKLADEAAAQEQVARTLFADMLSRAADSGMPTGDGVAPSRSLERKDLRAILMAMGLEPALLQRLMTHVAAAGRAHKTVALLPLVTEDEFVAAVCLPHFWKLRDWARRNHKTWRAEEEVRHSPATRPPSRHRPYAGVGAYLFDAAADSPFGDPAASVWGEARDALRPNGHAGEARLVVQGRGSAATGQPPRPPSSRKSSGLPSHADPSGRVRPVSAMSTMTPSVKRIPERAEVAGSPSSTRPLSAMSLTQPLSSTALHHGADAAGGTLTGTMSSAGTYGARLYSIPRSAEALVAEALETRTTADGADWQEAVAAWETATPLLSQRLGLGVPGITAGTKPSLAVPARNSSVTSAAADAPSSLRGGGGERVATVDAAGERAGARTHMRDKLRVDVSTPVTTRSNTSHRSLGYLMSVTPHYSHPRTPAVAAAVATRGAGREVTSPTHDLPRQPQTRFSPANASVGARDGLHMEGYRETSSPRASAAPRNANAPGGSGGRGSLLQRPKSALRFLPHETPVSAVSRLQFRAHEHAFSCSCMCLCLCVNVCMPV